MLTTTRTCRLGCSSASGAQAFRRPARAAVPAKPQNLSAWNLNPRVGKADRLVAAKVASGQAKGAKGPSDMTGKRNVILPVDNTSDSEFAVSWALDHIYKANDCLHLLHSIPPYHSKETFNEAEALAHSERQEATKDEVRKRFETRFILSSVPTSDIVYDISEEDHVSVGLFGASACS